MAIVISRMLTQSLIPRSFLRTPTALSTHHRHRSSKSHRAQLIEVDLDSSAPSEELIAVGMKTLEDAIHGMIVRRAAPDWLPFLPGYSYWVPPPRSAGAIRKLPSSDAMIEVIRKLAARNNNNNNNKDDGNSSSLSDEEHMSCSSPKGWPASSFFLDDSTSMHAVPVVEVELNIQRVDDGKLDGASNSEDEEG